MRYSYSRMLKKSLAILSVIMFTVNVVFAQADIDTTNIENIIHVNVNHINASDDNTGLSPDDPIKTLQKAINLCKDIRSKIMVYPGHYRSYIDILSNELLILEATEPGEVYISGSDVFTEWTLMDSVYTHQWDYNWGYFDDSNFCFGPCLMSDYQKRRELVFIDSLPVKQVVNINHLAPNTFYVDEANNRILLYPDEAVDMQTAMVEVATRGFNIYNEGRNGSLVKATVLNESGLIIRGIVFQHVANTAHQDALTISHTTNVIIEDCIFQWNNGVGMELGNCTNITVRNSVLRHNGERGMGVAAGLNVHISGLEIYENNWRTNAPKIIAHDAAGIKIIGGTENCILEDIHAYNNYCHVIWFDWNNGNYEIRNSLIEHNQEAGIMLEASRKPASVVNTKLLYNRIGILGYGHANVSVDSCFLFANGSQISLGQDGRTVSQDNNWEINCNDWKIKNSKIISASPIQGMLSFFQFLSPSTRASNNYFTTAEADSNTYYHPKGDQQWPNGESINGGQLTLDEWRNVTGQDINSVWQKPSAEEVGGNEPPVAILEYEFFNDTIVRFFADKSYDPEGLINSYKWYFGDGETSDSKNINHFYRITGNVEVSLVVTDFFNEKDSVTTSLYIGTSGIQEDFNSKPVSFVYPNPVKDYFYVKVAPELGINKGKVVITNILGQIVFEHDFLNTDNTQGPFDVSNLNSGVYLVSVIKENGEKTTQKIIRYE
jgi:hypothetical protein